MNGLVLCFLLLAVLPCALGIQCYTCTPDNTTFCDTAQQYNTTNCTTDACGALSVTSGTQLLQNTTYKLMCVNQSSCSAYKAEACQNATQRAAQLGYNMTSCEMECCQTDNCNTKALFTTTSSPTTTAATTWQAPTDTAMGNYAEATLVCLLFGGFVAVMDF